MRRPTERLAQRRLVYELRHLVDRGRVEEARALVNEHPRAWRSAHVRHNVGRARARALLGGPEAARSLSKESLRIIAQDLRDFGITSPAIERDLDGR